MEQHHWRRFILCVLGGVTLWAGIIGYNIGKARAEFEHKDLRKRVVQLEFENSNLKFKLRPAKKTP